MKFSYILIGFICAILFIIGIKLLQKKSENFEIPIYAPSQVNMDGAPVDYSTMASDFANTERNQADIITYPDIDATYKYENLDCHTHVYGPSIVRVPNYKLTVPPNRLLFEYTNTKPMQNKTINTDIMAANGTTVNRNLQFSFPATYMGYYPYIRGHNYASVFYEPEGDIDHIGFIMRDNHIGEPVALGSVIAD